MPPLMRKKVRVYGLSISGINVLEIGLFNPKIKFAEKMAICPLSLFFSISGTKVRKVLKQQNAEHGTRNTEHGTRNTELGTRNSEHGTRNTERGIHNSFKHFMPCNLLVSRIVFSFVVNIKFLLL